MQCLTRRCINNKCTARGNGETCEQDYECDKQSFVRSPTCFVGDMPKKVTLAIILI